MFSAFLGLLAVIAFVWLALCVYRYVRIVRFRLGIGEEARTFMRDQESAGHFDYDACMRGRKTQPRGIVMCAGGRNLLSQAFTNLDILRNRHGCSLPVELFYVGEAEMPPACCAFFEREFAPLRCLDATKLPPLPGHPPLRNIAGYQLKGFALAWTSFDVLLLIDADNIPTRDPSEFFELDLLQRHGNVFWPDTVLMSVIVEHPRKHAHLSLADGNRKGTVQSFNPRIFDHLGLKRPATLDRVRYETESGQMLIDRRHVWKALHMVWFLNARERFFYLYMHGDTGSFPLAFALADTHFVQVPEPLSCAGTVRDGCFCGRVFLQRDPKGRVAFYHQVKRKTNLDAAWIRVTHTTSDPPSDHPRARSQRGCVMIADVDELVDLRELDAELAAFEEAVHASFERLVARQHDLHLPEIPRKALFNRRLLPW